MSANNGGPAFPRPGFYEERADRFDTYPQDGMTLRDYFAAAVVPSVYAEYWRDRTSVSSDWEMDVAVDAFRMADAMLRARGEV